MENEWTHRLFCVCAGPHQLKCLISEGDEQRRQGAREPVGAKSWTISNSSSEKKKRNKDGNNTVRLGGLERRAPARALLYIHTRTCFRICTVTRSRVLLFLSTFSLSRLVLLTLSMKKTFCLVGSAAGCGRVQGCTPCRYPLVAFFFSLSLSLGRFYCFFFFYLSLLHTFRNLSKRPDAALKLDNPFSVYFSRGSRGVFHLLHGYLWFVITIST